MRALGFSPKQRQVLDWWRRDGFDAVICDGAVRSGKTFALSVSFFLWAMARFHLEGLENSCLVNPADHKEIAAAVISLSEKGTVMTSERKPYSRLKKFSLEAVSARMKKIYAKGGF